MNPQKKITQKHRNKAYGCLIGMFIGDALGAIVEFEDSEHIQWKFPKGVREFGDPGVWKLAPGQITDDSEMALAMIQSILKNGKYDAKEAKRAYIEWRNTAPFGIGGTIKKALSGKYDRSSQANGAMMRAAPLGILGLAFPDKIINWAEEDCKITHVNRVCSDANKVFVMALYTCLATDKSPLKVYEFILGLAKKRYVAPTVLEALTNARKYQPDDYQTQMGWVLIALQNAFWQLLHAENFEDGVVSTINCGGDTDTNGAIVGALLGAYYGIGAIPQKWQDTVLNCEPQYGSQDTQYPRPEWLWPTNAKKLVRQLIKLGS